MAKPRYRFQIDLYGDDADPQAIGEFIEDLIEKKREHVTADELVAAGRAATSPLHPCFTFDENVAADKWRRHEARALVKNLHLASKDNPEKAGKTKAFVYVHHPDHANKRVLLSMRSAMARPEMKVQVVAQAVRALQRSLSYWSSLYGANPEMRALAKDVDRLTKRAERDLLAALAA